MKLFFSIALALPSAILALAAILLIAKWGNEHPQTLVFVFVIGILWGIFTGVYYFNVFDKDDHENN
jgi:hypothetical protein